jgi:plasmid stability protein
VETRNITFSLPSELVRQAKVYAAQHDTTVNALVRDLLQEKIARDERIRAAADRLVDLASRGPYFMVDPGSITRDDLHERS